MNEETEVEPIPPASPILIYKLKYLMFTWPRRVVNHWVVLEPGRLPCARELVPHVAIGPHWPGIIFVVALLVGSTHYICSMWPWVSSLALLLCTACLVFLGQVCCTDPGFVTANATAGDDTEEELCFCEECQLFQPENAYHCDFCGRCIDGWDHHCIWMGQCIGKGNIRYFWRFNASWLIYLGFLMLLTWAS